VALIFVGAAPAGRADEVGITGTVTPNTFSVVVEPTTIDLSCRAGQGVGADVWVRNRGTIGASVKVASMTFDGLTAVDPSEFDPKANSCADKCTLQVSVVMGGRGYYISALRGLNVPVEFGLSSASGTVPELPLHVDLQTNTWCPGATLTGKIVLDIQPAP
jgi:hypothetical protein